MLSGDLVLVGALENLGQWDTVIEELRPLKSARPRQLAGPMGARAQQSRAADVQYN